MAALGPNASHEPFLVGHQNAFKCPVSIEKEADFFEISMALPLPAGKHIH